MRSKTWRQGLKTAVEIVVLHRWSPVRRAARGQLTRPLRSSPTDRRPVIWTCSVEPGSLVQPADLARFALTSPATLPASTDFSLNNILNLSRQQRCNTTVGITDASTYWPTSCYQPDSRWWNKQLGRFTMWVITWISSVLLCWLYQYDHKICQNRESKISYYKTIRVTGYPVRIHDSFRDFSNFNASLVGFIIIKHGNAITKRLNYTLL